MLEAVSQDESAEPGPAASDDKSDSGKLLLRGVRDLVNTFDPLKSVAGGLRFVPVNREVCDP